MEDTTRDFSKKNSKPEYIAFTWTPDPSRYTSTRPDIQYITCLHILKLAKRCLSDYVFYPELSLQGNIHIHGIYKIKDNIKYHRNFLPKVRNLGWTLLKPVFNWEDWCAYVMKSNEDNDMACIVGHDLPVPLTEDSKYYIKLNTKTVFSNKYRYNKKRKITDYF